MHDFYQRVLTGWYLVLNVDMRARTIKYIAQYSISLRMYKLVYNEYSLDIPPALEIHHAHACVGSIRAVFLKTSLIPSICRISTHSYVSTPFYSHRQCI